MEKTPHIYISEKKECHLEMVQCVGKNWETVTLFLLEKHKKGYFQNSKMAKKDKKFHEQQGGLNHQNFKFS